MNDVCIYVYIYYASFETMVHNLQWFLKLINRGYYCTIVMFDKYHRKHVYINYENDLQICIQHRGTDDFTHT